MSELVIEFEEMWAANRATRKRYSQEMLNGNLNGQAMKIKLEKNRKEFDRRVKWWFEGLSYVEKIELVQASVEHEILWANIRELMRDDLMAFRILVS